MRDRPLEKSFDFFTTALNWNYNWLRIKWAITRSIRYKLKCEIFDRIVSVIFQRPLRRILHNYFHNVIFQLPRFLIKLYFWFMAVARRKVEGKNFVQVYTKKASFSKAWMTNFTWSTSKRNISAPTWRILSNDGSFDFWWVVLYICGSCKAQEWAERGNLVT